MRVAETGLTMAEYFRDKEHQNVLLFIDKYFSVLHRSRFRKYPHFLDVCHQP